MAGKGSAALDTSLNGDRQKIRILSVDDSKANQDVISNAFAGRDYEVTIAMSGSDAIETMQKANASFDIILLDVMMPSLNGYDVCKHVRQDMRQSSEVLPIIMMSAVSPSDKVGFEGMKSGANDFVAKPFDVQELQIKVKEVVASQRENKMRIEAHKRRSMLQALMPMQMADRVFSGETDIAHDIPMLSVLCFSVVHWEKLVNDFDAFQTVQHLNTIQSAYEKHRNPQKVYQLRTPASSFMAIAGQDGDTYHAETLLKLALAILAEVEDTGLELHFGLHSGAAQAGVIGTEQPNYCLFGDTLQLVQAMIDQTPPGCLCFSDAAKNQLEQLGQLSMHRLPAGARVIERGKLEPPSCKAVQLWLLVRASVSEEAINQMPAASARPCAVQPLHAQIPSQQHAVVAASPQPLAGSHLAAPAGGWRLLSVDDDEVNQEVVTGMFKPEGLDVTIAMNGVECLNQIDKGSFHIVLLDSMMPGMSGLEVCKTLRKRFTHLELPIIMLTCRTAAEEAAEAIDAGCNDYVRKPFTRVELVARVHVHLAMRHERNALQQQIRELMTKAQNLAETHQSERVVTQATPAPIVAVPRWPLQQDRSASALSVRSDIPNGNSYRSGPHCMEVKELKVAFREQERALRMARAELAACRAKLKASEGDADEVWHRLGEAETALLDYRHMQQKMKDEVALAKIGLGI